MIADNQLVILINQMLESDNEIRNKNEATFLELRDNYPNEFIVSLLNICKHEELKIRQFATIHLRNCTSTFAPKNFKNVWPALTPPTQEYVKTQLFVLLSEEQSQNVRNQLCDCIGEIGGSLYEETNNQWPGLLPLLWQMFLSPRADINECGFKIMSNLFTYGSDMFSNNIADIGALFTQGLVNAEIRIRSVTIQAIGNWVTSCEPKQYKPFEDLVPQMIQSTYEILLKNEELGESAYETFTDIVDAEYKFVRKHFQSFFQGVFQIFKEKTIDEGIKRIGTEALLILAEKQPKLYKANSGFITQLVEMIFYHMIQISDEITPQWKTPCEGFNDDIEQDEDCETARFGMSSIDRLIECIGEKELLPIVSQTVQQLFQHQDWRYKYAALMALSQVGEYIEEIDEIRPIITVIMTMLNDPNPMLRYAVCHAVGQISDDMKPKFQESFLDTILPALLQRIQVDDVPRVTSHILACLTNFVEGVEKGISPYTQSLVQIAVQLIQNSISIVKENAMSILAATAEAAKEEFAPYVPTLMPLLFSVLQMYQTKEYKQLKGQTMETITLIASSVKQQVFSPFIQQTIELLVTIQEGQFESVDPQKSYVLSGWQRLCLVCPDQLALYLPRIIPSLFSLVRVIFDSKSKEESDTQFHTYDNEEAEIAINMLSVFIEQLKEKFFPFFKDCTDLIVPLCKFNTDESIRRASAKCLVSLIENVKSTGQLQPLIEGATYFLGVILEAAQTEFDAEVIIEQVDCLKEIIDIVEVTFMTSQQLNELSEKVFKLLMESDQRKADNEKMAKDDEVDEDEVVQIKEENETEEELHVKIAEFIGVLFKTHKGQVQQLCELICSTILPRVLDQTLSAKMHQFGMFLIDDIVEHLGYQLAGPKFLDFAKALVVYSQDRVCFVRQAAVYGIGILAINTPKEAYPQFGQQLIEAVVKSLQIVKSENDTDKAYGHCRDNSIAALGKIIKNQSESLGGDLSGALQTWLNLLPLKFDKPEARLQHVFLAEVVKFNGDQLLSGKLENAFKIIKVFIDVYETKKSDSQTDQKILEALQTYENLELVKTNWNSIYTMLSPQNQTKLLEMANRGQKTQPQ